MTELLKAKMDLYRLLNQQEVLTDNEFDILRAIIKDLEIVNFKQNGVPKIHK